MPVLRDVAVFGIHHIAPSIVRYFPRLNSQPLCKLIVECFFDVLPVFDQPLFSVLYFRVEYNLFGLHVHILVDEVVCFLLLRNNSEV